MWDPYNIATVYWRYQFKEIEIQNWRQVIKNILFFGDFFAYNYA